MTPKRTVFFSRGEMSPEVTGPGVQRRIMGTDNQIMLVAVEFAAGAKGARHSHFHTQSSFIVSGLFTVDIDGEIGQMKGGDGFYVAPNLPHEVTCIEAGEIIDCFSPVREDFL